MTHPFEEIPPHWQTRLFGLLVLLSVVLPAAMMHPGLTTEAAPAGIVSFELAGTVAASQAMVDSWSEEARLHMAFGLGLDYLFLGVYSSAIILAILWARRHWQGGALVSIALPLAWAQWLAALCDAIENAALLRILERGATEPWPLVAAGCAGVKFLLIALGLLYALTGLVARARR